MHTSLISLICLLEMIRRLPAFAMPPFNYCVVGRGSGAISSCSWKGWSWACNVPWYSLGLLPSASSVCLVVADGVVNLPCEAFGFYLSTEQDFGEKGWQLEASLADACGSIFGKPQRHKNHKHHKHPQSRIMNKWNSHRAHMTIRCDQQQPR